MAVNGLAHWQRYPLQTSSTFQRDRYCYPLPSSLSMIAPPKVCNFTLVDYFRTMLGIRPQAPYFVTIGLWHLNMLCVSRYWHHLGCCY